MAEPALPRLSVLRNTKAAIGNDGGLFVVLLAGNMVVSGLGESLLGATGRKTDFPVIFSRRGTVAARTAAAQP